MEENNSVLMGTAATIILFFFSIAYNLIWGVLFIVVTRYQDYKYEECGTLVKWNNALYIMYFIIAFLSLIQFIFQLIQNKYKKDSSIPSIIIGCKSCLNCFGGLTILIGINVEYMKVPIKEDCGSLNKLNLAFIITEWGLYGCFCLFTLAAGIFATCKNNNEDDQ